MIDLCQKLCFIQWVQAQIKGAMFHFVLILNLGDQQWNHSKYENQIHWFN